MKIIDPYRLGTATIVVMDWKEKLGEELQRARRRKGLTREKLREVLGGAGFSISLTALGQYERGERPPGIEDLRQIAAVLGSPYFEIDEKLRIEFTPNGRPRPAPLPQQLSLDFDDEGGVTVRIESAKEGLGVIIKKMA